jgi:RNA polymerase sigma-70 factor (ECF subfamily)
MIEPDLDALRAGSEDAFRELVSTLQSPLMRLAMLSSPSRAVAEEVVQETWVAVIRSIDSFEGRSSLRTWISRILLNTARRRAGREARSLPFSSLGSETAEPSVDPDRFHPDGPFVGHWISTPPDPSSLPERRLLAAEIREQIAATVRELAPAQRAVFVLRDVEGWPTAEICELLEIAPGNARVLLHRARTKVRETLENALGEQGL